LLFSVPSADVGLQLILDTTVQ